VGSDEVADRFLPLARDALRRHDVSASARLRLLNLSENVTYLVEDPEQPGTGRSVLRLHRPGYHSRAAVLSELAWVAALREQSVVSTPAVLPTPEGEAVVTAHAVGLRPRLAVRFVWLDGSEPGGGRLSEDFRVLGGVAARLHRHVRSWTPPPGFVRQRWDAATTIGPDGLWGRWQDGPGVGPEQFGVLSRLAATLPARLARHGLGADRFGLIHADMRLANLLVQAGPDGRVLHVIDFDDCGFGWFGYDLAAALSFIEDDPRVPELTTAWLDGYRRIEPLPAAVEAELPTFLLLRRLLLLAWLGSHAEVPLARQLAPTFATGTCELAEQYLTRFG
jgi:Ser/Thr protein kinase RdoA (MazF antagonist)